MRRPRIGARRGAAVLVLVASCISLLATSQPPDQAVLTASRLLTTTLSAETPRATATLDIALSAEALPVGSETIRQVTGELKLTAGGVERGRLVVDVEAAASPLAPTLDPYGATVVPIEQLCAGAEACEAEVTVAVEWLGAPRGASSQVNVSAVIEIVYDGVQELPLGASASVGEVAALAPAAPGPSLSAQTPDEQIVLDRDHWAAARHVRLTASPATLDGYTLAFLDQAVGKLTEGAVLVTIIPDEDRGDRLDPTVPFDPFAGCSRRAPCERGFTIRFELSLVESDSVATVRWAFGARAAFPEEPSVPTGAQLAAEVDSRADATMGVPTGQETLAGTLVFVRDAERSRFLSQGVRLEVRVPPAALPAGAFGGLPPAARAILTVRGAVDGHVSVQVKSEDERAQHAGRRWTTAIGGASVLLNPLRDCGISIGCTRTILVSVMPQVGDDVEGPIEITWELDVVLAYPELDEVPPLALLELRVLPERG